MRPMQNAERWRPTKYVRRGGVLTASRDPKSLSPASRLVASLVAAQYDRHLSTYCRGTLADLGCGDVPLYASYRDHVTDVTCIDWDRTIHTSTFLDATCSLNEDLPLPDGSYDTLLLSDVLEHLPEPEHLWLEAHRILRPGGHLLLNVPFLYWLHEQPDDYYRYTEFALRRFAGLVGFEVLVLEPIGGAPESLTDLLAKSLLGVGRVGRFLGTALQDICLALVSTRPGRAISARSAAVMPLGYFMVVRKPDRERAAVTTSPDRRS